MCVELNLVHTGVMMYTIRCINVMFVSIN
jgi:hypothetical protein